MRPFRQLLVLAAAILPLTAYLPIDAAKAADPSTFNPGLLVSDSVFTASSMSVGEIQTFLLNQGSILASVPSSDLGDGAAGRSAAQIIYDAAHNSISDFGGSNRPGNPFTVHLNPQVILTTLQKETSLITGSYTIGSVTLNNMLRIAMGYGCPDGGGCNEAYAGFANQVTYGAAQLYLDYWRANNGTANGYAVGSQQANANNPVYPPYCPNGGTVSFTVGNAATSSLYRYTPHVCNGNANFWFLMEKWFIPELFRPDALAYDPNSGSTFVIEDNRKWPIVSQGFANWGFSWGDVSTITPEQRALPTGAIWTQLVLGTDGTVYYIDGGKKRPLTSARLMDRYGFSWGDVAPKPDVIMDQVPYGLPMHELVLPAGDGTVYLATAGTLYPVSGTVYNDSWAFAWPDTARVPAYVTEHLAQGPLLTNLFVIDRGDGTAYLIDRGIVYSISGSVAKAWGFNLSNLRTVGPALVAEKESGGGLTTLAKQAAGDGTIYLIKDGKKYPMSGGYFRSRGYRNSDVKVMSPALLSTLSTGNTLR